MEFRDTTFTNMTFEYSGGAFVLVNDTFSTPVRVQLKGAAANTMGLIALVQALNSGARPRPMDPNAPVLRKTSEKHTVTVDFNSPFTAPQ
jgi:hypothetical protein